MRRDDPSPECRINGVTVHYLEHGSGVPLVALHGAGVDHREIEAAIDAVVLSATGSIGLSLS